MKDSVRRILLFVVILIAGLVLILFDLPAVFLVLVVIALAFVALLINGSIKLPNLRVPKLASSKKGTKTEEKGQKSPVTQKAASEKSGKKPEPSPKKVTKTTSSTTTGRFSTIRGAFSSMGQAFSVIAGDIGKARKTSSAKQRDKQKLDQMLDQSVQGRAPDIRSLKEANPEIVPSGKQTVSDPFSTLVKEQMNTELLDSEGAGEDLGDLASLNDFDLGADMSGAFGDDIANLDISLDAEEGIAIDDDSDTDEVASILAANMGDLDPGEEETDPLSDDMNLGGLEDLDINSIDLDQELGDPDNPEKKESRTVAQPEKSPPGVSQKPTSSSPAVMGGSPLASAPSAKPAIVETPKEMSNSMMAFSSGKGMDDDLMSSLKSDAAGVKRNDNAPLLRDLKDVKVPATDLEKDLEGILNMTKVKK